MECANLHMNSSQITCLLHEKHDFVGRTVVRELFSELKEVCLATSHFMRENKDSFIHAQVKLFRLIDIFAKCQIPISMVND